MFGLSIGEWVVLLIVAMVVFGPKELPKILRKAGQWAGKIRRFAFDMRAQSGIDEVLRTEGLDREILEIRKLARGELDGVATAVRSATRLEPPAPAVTSPAGSPPAASNALPDASAAPSSSTGPAAPLVRSAPPAAPPFDPYQDGALADGDREYPRDGPDAYGALPDTAAVTADALPVSAHAADPVYARGEAAEAGTP